MLRAERQDRLSVHRQINCRCSETLDPSRRSDFSQADAFKATVCGVDYNIHVAPTCWRSDDFQTGYFDLALNLPLLPCQLMSVIREMGSSQVNYQRL